MKNYLAYSALFASVFGVSLSAYLNSKGGGNTKPPSSGSNPSPTAPVTPPKITPPVTPPVVVAPTPKPEEPVTPPEVVTPAPTATTVERKFNVRPYGPKAPWNRPVAGLPLHPQSSTYAQYLYNDFDSRKLPEMNFRKYTYPVYNAQEATQTYTVVSNNPSWGNLHNKQIPFNPAWLPNEGTDGQIIILDPATGREWNLWEVAVNTNAKRITIGNGNLCPGDYLTNNWDNAATKCSSSRGVGINYLAMLVRPFEIEQGKIEHALSMPIKGTSGSFYVAPATKLEHPGKVGTIPEGMRFALKITDAEIEAHIARLKKTSYAKTEAQMRAVRIILVALRDYGWFITDTAAGHAFQFEAPQTALAKWKQLGVIVNLDQDMFPRYMLDGLMTPQRIITIAPSDQYPAMK